MKRLFTWRSVHQAALRWLDSKSLEFIRVYHWKNDCLDEPLNLLLQTSNICVIFFRPFVNFHGVYTRVKFCR